MRVNKMTSTNGISRGPLKHLPLDCMSGLTDKSSQGPDSGSQIKDNNNNNRHSLTNNTGEHVRLESICRMNISSQA